METEHTSKPGRNAPGQETWDANLYDSRHSFIWKAGAGVVDLLEPRPGERILDLGCGTGHLTHSIAERGASVAGIDASPEMIEAARAAYPEIPFYVMRGEDFSFPEPFDAVFSNAALHWMARPADVAACVARALRPGGRFVAEFGGKGNVARLLDALFAAIRAEVPEAQPENPWYFPSIAEYAGLLESAGLETTFAVLFDRPSTLEGEEGFRAWVRMFGDRLLSAVPEDRHGAILARAEEIARPALYYDGAWHADYRRLRIVAIRPGGSTP